MANFELALPTIMRNEGRKANHPQDPGGATNYGVSLRFLRQTSDLNLDGWQDGDINHDGKIDEQDINQLSDADAESLFCWYFWEPNRYDQLTSQIVATKLVDLAINMGGKQANVIAQRAVRAASGEQLVEDGIMGDKTIRAINACHPLKLLTAIKSEAAGFYRLLVTTNPALKAFERGWLNRAYSTIVEEK